jgi:hypothetical protein
MNSDNKQIRDVADVAARIMAGLPVTEKLHPNQQVLDVHEPEKDELTADDFKKLRAKKEVKKEEVEQMVQEREDDEYHTPSKHHVQVQVSKGDGQKTYRKATVRAKEPKHAVSAAIAHYKQQGYTVHDHKYLGEEVEQMDEVKMADLPSTKVQGRAYGASKPEPHAVDVMKGPKEKELKDIESEKKKKFSEMVGTYKNAGLKSFMEALSKEEEEKIIDEVSKEIADYTMDVIDAGEYTEVTIGEEASQEEFNAEIEKAKAKSQGKIKAEVAKAAVQAVKQEETEITDEMIFEVLENAGIDFESLSDNELQEVANEAYEILDELSKNTLGSYIKKANYAGGMADFKHGRIADKRGNSKEKTSLATTSTKRQKGISTAVNKLSKEEVELGEDNMNSAEMEKREKIVKGMKKGIAGFKERYGARAKNVMYATATKRAMEK